MVDRDSLRSTAGVRALVRIAGERGMAPTECLAGTAVAPAALLDPSAEIRVHDELRVVHTVLGRFGDEPGLGLEAAARQRFHLRGPWGLALLGSRTLRELIEVAQRSAGHTVPLGRLSFAEADGEARLLFQDTEIPPGMRAFFAEMTLAGLPAFDRELYTVGVPVRRVSFRHAAPRNIKRYREIFGVVPVFGAVVSGVVFDRGLLDQPLPPPNDAARDSCGQLCRDLLDRRRTRTGVAASVRDLLVRNPGEIPDQATVALGLYMSSRTLSRRLHEEGTSFRALLDEVRQTMSEVLLAHTDMTTEQVAARLGYAEAASFIRAFRRWQGCPPQTFRSRGPRPCRAPELV
ncbi:AraC family transcriptional regulator [Nocardia sp. NBC_00508]|uniref:AraC family transcriptional regulator n=1 Tax=Nocardia sp. NBC_00508 TaxID=2975992 RepID=UPI002E7FB9F3|nr:AraC family transcriptional regulator [Nocardia sp. NBC_00508]WUD66416.1 AraC family transcriptional regulator [Nocardia sp. NBC_00508]